MWTDSMPKKPKLQSPEATPPPPLRPFSIGSYRAIEHSRGTSTSRQAQQKAFFKATLPAVPTLFHLSKAYKTVKKGPILLWGATAHLLPALAPLKMLLLLLENEYTINLSHLQSRGTIRCVKPQRGLSP